jgi:hypothetical protein
MNSTASTQSTETMRGTSFASANDLMQALIRAATAHGEHEKRIGRYDEMWPKWYAVYMVAEQSGGDLPE